MPKIKVTWTCSKIIEIPADELNRDGPTEDAVNANAESAAWASIDDDPSYCEHLEWEWEGMPPMFIKPSYPLLEEHWFDLDGRSIATNGEVVITRNCYENMAVKIDSKRPWVIVVSETQKDFLRGLFNINIDRLPIHEGWFSNAYKCLNQYRVLGKLPKDTHNFNCAGYAVDDSEELMAIVIPLILGTSPNFSEIFQFNPPSC